MTSEQLVLHGFRECTILMPTWFLHREGLRGVQRLPHRKVRGTCSFFKATSRVAAASIAVMRSLSSIAITRRRQHAIPRQTILRHRAAAIERAILNDWPTFTIWGAGRDGRDFFKALSEDARKRVSLLRRRPEEGGHDLSVF